MIFCVLFWLNISSKILVYDAQCNCSDKGYGFIVVILLIIILLV